MNENKKKMYDLSGPKTVEAMKKRHFDAYYCSTAAEAVEKALELIPKTDSVSWGGLTGQCGDCTSPDCICSYVVVTRYSMVHERIKVILVGEDLGL